MESTQESLSSRPWRAAVPPSRILVLRFHAIGDIAITLPMCVALRNRFPDARIDLLTGGQAKGLPESVDVFDSVLELELRGSRWIRLWRALVWGARLAMSRYDLVLDLQRNWTSRIIRWLAVPRAWSEFDRYSPVAAGERVAGTFCRAGFVDLQPVLSLPVKQDLIERGRKILQDCGWDGIERLVAVNPAGLWSTRNWPLEYYVEFCRLWLTKESVRFVLLGTERLGRKAQSLKEALGHSLLNLTGKTSLEEAMAILQFCSFMLTEDSGLMHMSWTSGIPTLALFGSSRHDWSRPLGPKSLCLHSGDLPCGACMDPVCRFGDVHCLTRFSPLMVFEASQSMGNKTVAGVAA